MTNYPVGDYLIRVKNAAMAGRRDVAVKNSKFVGAVAKALIRMQVLESVETKDGMLTSRLTFHRKAPLLVDLKLMSKPGLRRYVSIDQLKTRRRKDASTLILSTQGGIMSSVEAIKKGTGGEAIAEVW